MMPDYPLGQTLDFKFTTRQFSTGAPFALSGGAVEVYEDNDIAQIVAGETLTADFDGVTGLNNLRIVATGGNGYEVGKSYAAVLSAGTVDSVSVVGEVIAQFSIERSPALRPTTAGRTIDVLATGETPIDFDTSIGTLAAAQIEASALDGKGDWNTGKTGYSLAATGLDAIVSTATGMVEIAKAVWDRVLTGATHAVVDSAGRRVRDLQEFGVYDGGAIWIDTVNGSAGTTDFESGTAFNPVNTIADANTLAASLGISRFRIAPGSTITFAAAQVAQEFFGQNWTLALGGQNISNSYFHGADVSGIGTTATGAAHFNHCEIGTTSLGEVHLDVCGFIATITLTAVGDYTFSNCFSEVAGGTTPIIDFGAALGNTNLTMPDYSQGIEIRNLNATGTDLFSISGKGQIIYAASSSGAVNQRGDWKVTNTGGVTITADDNTTKIDAIPTTAMRGTDNAALASVATEARLAELDAANIPADLDAVLLAVGTNGVVISAATANQIADAILKRDWTLVSGEAARSALNALRFLRNKWSITGTTLTVTEEDDVAAAWTAEVSTDAAADPVTGSDPA